MNLITIKQLLVIADNLAVFVDRVFADVYNYGQVIWD